MGNITICQQPSCCCDNTLASPKEVISERIIEIKRDANKSISINTEQKPKEPTSFQAYDNFCLILKNVLRLQRSYRKYKERLKLVNRSKDSNDNSVNNINTRSLTNSSLNKKTTDDKSNIVDKIDISIQQAPPVNEVTKENNLQDKIAKSRGSIYSNCQSYVASQSVTSFFSHYSGLSSSNHNTFISIANNNTINYRDVNGNFTKKSKKGLKYKGNINKMTRQKNGFGVVKWEDGSHFSISFNNNHAEGPGKFYNATNKSIYNGYYENNIPKGYGCYESLQYQVTFEGEWCKKELSGIGIEIWNDETYYQGEYSESMKNGIGLYRWPDGTIYQGQWKRNSMTGYGMILYNDEKAYIGEVLNGQMHGYGEFTWKNGNFYAGYYVNDKKSGFGLFIWSRRPLIAYVGFWNEGNQNGPGISINGNTMKYGLWKEGRKDKTFQGYWELINNLRSEQVCYESFFKKDINSILSSFKINLNSSHV